MSYHDDFECYCPDEDEYFSDMQLYNDIEYEAKQGFWTTKEGRIIHVSKMETNHIKNVIRFLERHDKKDLYLPWINKFKEELEARSLF